MPKSTFQVLTVCCVWLRKQEETINQGRGLFTCRGKAKPLPPLQSKKPSSFSFVRWRVELLKAPGRGRNDLAPHGGDPSVLAGSIRASG